MNTPRRHMSLRLDPSVADGLAERARELGDRVTPLAETYVTEGLRMDRHPGIVVRMGAAGRRATLAGHRLDIWQVIETVRDSGGGTAAAGYLHLTPAQVRAAIAYYADFRDEIDGWIAGNAAASERAEAAFR